MREELKRFITNLITTILAMEIRLFFEKGGDSNELALTILKILFLCVLAVLIINMEEPTRIVINNKKEAGAPKENLVEGKISIGKLIKEFNKL